MVRMKSPVRGLLHLHDLGTPLAEQARAERRTDPGADVDDPQALEGARHAGGVSPAREVRRRVPPVPGREDLLHRAHLLALLQRGQRRGGVVGPLVRHEVVAPRRALAHELARRG